MLNEPERGTLCYIWIVRTCDISTKRNKRFAQAAILNPSGGRRISWVIINSLLVPRVTEIHLGIHMRNFELIESNRVNWRYSKHPLIGESNNLTNNFWHIHKIVRINFCYNLVYCHKSKNNDPNWIAIQFESKYNLSISYKTETE